MEHLQSELEVLKLALAAAKDNVNIMQQDRVVLEAARDKYLVELQELEKRGKAICE